MALAVTKYESLIIGVLIIRQSLSIVKNEMLIHLVVYLLFYVVIEIIHRFKRKIL